LYIEGYGRSGSTLLDIVLGNHPEVESVGELINLPYSGWYEGWISGKPTRSPYCACGERMLECEFWSAVRRKWLENPKMREPQRCLELQEEFGRYRSLPRLLREQRGSKSALFRCYADHTQALFKAIADVGGSESW
jgi:hypothetical protein